MVLTHLATTKLIAATCFAYLMLYQPHLNGWIVGAYFVYSRYYLNHPYLKEVAQCPS